MITSSSTVETRIVVNEDGQIVIEPGDVKTDMCSHVFNPLVLPRAMSLAVAEAVIAAQKGPAR